MKHYLIILIVFLALACDSSRVYEDYNDMDDAFWQIDSVQRFKFEIKDQELQYNLLASFRNASSYPFYNIYFQYSLKDSANKVLKEELKDFNLFDPKTGKPFGSGLGDVFDHTVSLEENYQFNYSGQYTLELKQFMRLDTLPFVLSVGARVELSE